MTQEHPITPPPELFKQWEGIPRSLAFEAAYRAGADMELEACCEWLETYVQRWAEWSASFRAARRPKPPSLKEQALDQLRSIQVDLTRCGMGISVETIRRALEALPDN